MEQGLTREAIMRNNPKRIERIQKFEAKIKFRPVDYEVSATMEFTDQIVMDEATFLELNDFVEGLIQQYGEKALFYLNQKVTGVLQDGLLECQALFGEEHEGDYDIDAGSEEGVMLQDDGTAVVKKLRWS
jgi:hypothetical protein